MLFRRLGVFAGAFALEAAEEVAAGGGVDGRDVADLLGRLVDKSLVVADEDRGGYRYRLLEPVRQYARERLAEAGEATTVEARHHAFYLDLARAADPEAAPAGPAVALDRLEAEHDNLRAALAWALRHDPEAALRLAVHMWPMWMAGSHFPEGSRWLDAALAAAPDATALRADGLRAAGGLEIRLGRTGGLVALGAERVEIFRALGDRAAVAHALDEVGVYEYMAGHYDDAQRRYAESRVLAEELGDEEVAAAVLHSEGVLAQCRGDFPGAREALLASLGRLRALPAGERRPLLPGAHGRAVRRPRSRRPGRRGCSSRRPSSSSAAWTPGARSATCWPGSATSRARRACASRRASGCSRAWPTSARRATPWARPSR